MLHVQLSQYVLCEALHRSPSSFLIPRELADRQQLVSLDRLIRRFRDGDAAVVYPQAASLLKYIVDQYGLDAVKALWLDDYAAFERITGKDLVAVEGGWRAWLAQ